MPTYVYACSSCDQTFEIDQRITEDPLTECGCGSSGTVRRVIQPIAVMFKGSGFHINDYKGASPATTAEAPKSASECSGTPSSCGACSPTPH